MSYDASKVAFIDTETTGLHPLKHHVWEIAVIVDGEEHLWQQKLSERALADSDPVSLEMTGWKDRYDEASALPHDISMKELTRLTQGRHLVGACPWFDERRLDMWLPLPSYSIEGNDTSLTPWHYHLIDIEALMVGWLIGRADVALDQTLGESYAAKARFPLPWKSSELSLAVGIDPDDPAYLPKHTAMADTRWCKALFEKIVGPPDA